MKKKIGLWMVVMMVLTTVFTGCASGSSKTEKSTSPTPEAAQASAEKSNDAADTSKSVELYGYLLGAPNPGFEDVQEKLNAMLKEDINATMEIDFIDWGVLDSKYPLILASGEEVDWIYTADWCKYATEASKKAFMEINPDELKKYMPLYSERISDAAWDQVSINGKIYMIPPATPDIKAYGYVLRKDLADKYGVDLNSITKIGELTPYLEAIKQNETGMIPFKMDNSFDLLGPIFQLMTEQDAMFSDALECGLVYAFDGKNTPNGVYSIFDEPVYTYLKNAAVQMKAWYDAGYINKDVYANQTKSTDSFQQGVSGISNDNTLGMQATLAKAKEAGWETHIVLNVNINGHTAANSYTNNGFAIAATSKNPERTLMAMDLLTQDKDYNTLLQYGIEGVSYVLTPDGKVDYPEGVTADTTPYNWENTGFWFINKEIQLPRATWTNDYIKMNDNIRKNVLMDDPNIGFTFSTESVKTQFANVQNVWTQYFAPIAVGNVDDVDSALDLLKAQLASAGYDELIQEAKTQFEAFQNK